MGSPAAPVLISCDNSVRTDYALTKGWNWISINVSNPQSNSVQNLLSNVGSEGDEIKGQKSVFDKYSSVAGWSGSLTAAGGLKPTDMYKLKLTKAGTAQINGTPLDPSKTPISIAAGWNWIGFVPQYNIAIDEALASYGPKEGDVIKSQRTFSMYYDQIGWVGTLGILEPGKGYMLQSSAVSSLIYPAKGMLKSGVETQDNVPAIVNYDVTNFPTNMTIVAALADSLLDTYGKVLAAYSGSTCVGFAHPITVGTTTRYFLTAGGDAVAQNLTFALVDTLSGTQADFVNQLVYSADASEGDLNAPYVLYKSKALETNGISLETVVDAYPNPFTSSLSIKGYLPRESNISVRMVNTLGKEIVNINAPRQAGVFSLDVQDLAPDSFNNLSQGWYNVEVTTSFGTYWFKVIRN